MAAIVTFEQSAEWGWVLASTHCVQVETMGRVQASEPVPGTAPAREGTLIPPASPNSNPIFPCPPRSRLGGSLGQTPLTPWP